MNGRMPSRKTSKSDNGPLDHQIALTARQEEVLGKALVKGYFEFPRRISLTNLSELVGVRPSTLSEILRSAERRVLESTVRVQIHERQRPQRSP
jgi:predicted DNA binding protein